MVQFAAGNLKDITNRPIVTGAPIYATDHEAQRNDVEARISELNGCLQALATNQSGSIAPTVKTRGSLYANTGTSGAVALYGDPDGQGADDQVATRLTAKDISFATGGTATFKLGGEIAVDTTQRTGTPRFQYTLPADTLDSDGDILNFTVMYSNSPSNQGVHQLNGVTIGIGGNFGAATVQVFSKTALVRTGSTTARSFRVNRINRDSSGASALITEASASGLDFSAAQILQDVSNSPTSEINQVVIQ